MTRTHVVNVLVIGAGADHQHVDHMGARHASIAPARGAEGQGGSL